MATEESTETTERGGVASCSCKVGKAIDRYGLVDLNDQLVMRWKGEGDEQFSLRELESYVNKQILRAALEAADNDVIAGEVDNYYRLLTDDDASSANRVEAERRLQRQGVDPESVAADFVSHQTVHTHLRECLDESYDSTPDPETRLENGRKFIEATQTRTQTISEGTLSQLRDAEILDLGEFDVFVDLMVSCNECGRILSAADVFENRGCVCQVDDAE